MALCRGRITPGHSSGSKATQDVPQRVSSRTWGPPHREPPCPPPHTQEPPVSKGPGVCSLHFNRAGPARRAQTVTSGQPCSRLNQSSQASWASCHSRQPRPSPRVCGAGDVPLLCGKAPFRARQGLCAKAGPVSGMLQSHSESRAVPKASSRATAPAAVSGTLLEQHPRLLECLRAAALPRRPPASSTRRLCPQNGESCHLSAWLALSLMPSHRSNLAAAHLEASGRSASAAWRPCGHEPGAGLCAGSGTFRLQGPLGYCPTPASRPAPLCSEVPETHLATRVGELAPRPVARAAPTTRSDTCRRLCRPPGSHWFPPSGRRGLPAARVSVGVVSARAMYLPGNPTKAARSCWRV